MDMQFGEVSPFGIQSEIEEALRKRCTMCNFFGYRYRIESFDKDSVDENPSIQPRVEMHIIRSLDKEAGVLMVAFLNEAHICFIVGGYSNSRLQYHSEDHCETLHELVDSFDKAVREALVFLEIP